MLQEEEEDDEEKAGVWGGGWRRSFNCKGREEMGLPARRRDLWILAAVLASEKKLIKKSTHSVWISVFCCCCCCVGLCRDTQCERITR